MESRYPNLVEVLIADGGSTDSTREIVAELVKTDSRVKLIDNPQKYQSYALNKMIDTAEGELFLRADAHCYYNGDYIEKCVETLLRTGVKNAGGSQRYKAQNPVQAGIALAVKSYLGNGGAKYMNESYEGFGDTVFLGCFRTEDLREIGGFNTVNITNQDSELNLRLIKRFGEKSVFISPGIKSWYYPRDTLFKLFKQYFRYGRGRFLTKLMHPKQSPVRGMMPFLFVLTLILLLAADIFTRLPLYSVWVAGFLFLVLIAETVRVVLKNRQRFTEEIWSSSSKPPGILNRTFYTAVCIIIMQTAHFSGFLYQIIRRLLVWKTKW